MTGSRQIADIVSRFAGVCEGISETEMRERRGELLSTAETAPGQYSVLTRTIEAEVIPRLMLAHRSTGESKTQLFARTEIAEFVRIAVQHDMTVAEAFVQALIDQGATVEQIFSKLFAPAARRLGEMWESDECTFADVTIGLSRIQQLVHGLSSMFEGEGLRRSGTYSALLVPVPGEQHSLGLMIVEEYLRQAGWNVWSPCNLSESQLFDAAKREHFDMIGISVTCDVKVERLSALISSLRSASANTSVKILVGGRPINDNPSLVNEVGADATDTDGSNIVTWYESRVEQRAH